MRPSVSKSHVGRTQKKRSSRRLKTRKSQRRERKGIEYERSRILQWKNRSIK